MTRNTSAVRTPLLDPLDELQLALDVAAVPHHPLDERLHDYQRLAVAHLHAHPRAGLLMVPGLGKSAITASALTSVHLPALVIAPMRVTENVWPEEMELWRPDLTYTLVRGQAKERADKLEEETDVHLITWDTFSGDLSSKMKKPRYRTVVLDELSKVKGRGQRWRHANRLVNRGDIPYVWGLTGTPTPNTLLDLWPQLFLLDRGARLERTVTAYRTKYFRPGARLPNGVITAYTLVPGAEDVINHKIEDVCFSVPKSKAKYPEELPVYHHFKLSAPVRKVYRDMLREFVAEVAGELVSVEHAGAKTSKLRQIANGFMYHTGLIGVEESEQAETTHHHMGKVDLLKDILDEAQGAPALVFYAFNEDKRRLLHLPGAVDIRTPHSVERWNKGNIPLLIAHPASAGHGLNLQHGGSLLVWYGLTWSSEEYVQGNGRLVRPGQPSPAVAVHHLIAEDTVDEDMLDVVQGKISRQDALLKFLQKGKFA